MDYQILFPSLEWTDVEQETKSEACQIAETPPVIITDINMLLQDILDKYVEMWHTN